MTTPNHSDLPKNLEDTALAMAAAFYADRAATRDVNPRGVLLVAAPGVGTTMLARRATGLLPPLTEHARRWHEIEWRTAYERGGVPMAHGLTFDAPPFRAPHHTCSRAAIVGGTLRRPTECDCHAAPPAPTPGELHYARFGVLMLDEVTSFHPDTIAALAAALPKMGGTAPKIIATATPCPCGFNSHPDRRCTCSPAALDAHRARLHRAAATLDLRIVDVPAASLLDRDRGAARCASTHEILWRTGWSIWCAFGDLEGTEPAALREGFEAAARVNNSGGPRPAPRDAADAYAARTAALTYSRS